MALCKFWQQGHCRNGNNCRFEHPSKQPSYGGGNRFGALANQYQSRNNNQGMNDYGVTVEIIQNDLAQEVPGWILSCYGPGRNAPIQLIGGMPREQSFEEMRLYFMEAAQQGKHQEALSEIDGLWRQAQAQIRNTLSDPHGAIKFISDGGQTHPNRIDICRQFTVESTGEFLRERRKELLNANPFSRPNNNQPLSPVNNPFGTPVSNPFGGSGNSFGQPSGVGQTSGAFGNSAFGQASSLGASSPFGGAAQPSTGAFGQPSAIGAKPSAFGAPAFGQPAQPTSAFGQPSQPAAPAFGQTSQPSAFGQTAALGAKPSLWGTPSGPSPFSGAGGTIQPAAAANPFGAPGGPSPFSNAESTAQPAANPFGAPAGPSPFSNAASTSQPTSNPFGAPATTAAAPANNPFGAASGASAFHATTQPTTSPFGQPATTATTSVKSAFGTPSGTPSGASAFGQPSAPTNAFSKPSLQPPAANPFGAPSPQPAASAFGNTTTQAITSPTSGPVTTAAARQHPDPPTYIVKDANVLRQFHHKPVVYGAARGKQVPMLRGFDGTNQRIWFPDGPPPYSAETEAQPGPDGKSPYDDPQVQKQWTAFVNNGDRFEGGVMPEVPPKREYCGWAF